MTRGRMPLEALSAMSGEIAVLLALITANGLFAMAEIAVVSARPTRLRQMAEAGSRGGRAALALSESPGTFLATIQIGITFVGIVSGAYGEATLARHLEPAVESLPVIGAHPETVAGGLVVLGITYLTLVLGELAPKSLALTRSESIAVLVAPPMRVLGRLSAPAVWLLSRSANAVTWLVLRGRQVEETVSREIDMMLEDWSEQGVLEEAETELAQGLLDLAERTVESIMTHRSDVVWLDVGTDGAQLRSVVTARRYATVPVAEGTLDRPIGAVRARDLLAALLTGEPIDLRALARPLPSVPERMSALGLLQSLEDSQTHMALVIDDYGEVAGIATLTDVMQVIVGPTGALSPKFQRQVVRLDVDTWSIDATMPIDEFEERWDVEVADDDRRGYQTVAGLLLNILGGLPDEGEEVTYGNLRLRVQEIEGQRIVRVQVHRTHASRR